MNDITALVRCLKWTLFKIKETLHVLNDIVKKRSDCYNQSSLYWWRIFSETTSVVQIYVFNTYLYYINTNEIPGKLSRENMISSRVKIACYFHMWKYHRCYGYIINRAFRRKKLFQWNVWYFIGAYIINRTLHGRLEIRHCSSRVENIFQHSKRNFVSSRGHVISSI